MGHRGDRHGQVSAVTASQRVAPHVLLGPMKSDEPAFGYTISIRLSEKLNADLKRAAAEESNPPSAVARRLITAGLERELRQKRVAMSSGNEAA